MVNLKNLSKAELQATGFKNVSTARNFIKDILKTKSQKFKKDELINKLTSEFNKFKDFGIDLNDANKTANKAKLTTKKTETIIKKGEQDLYDLNKEERDKQRNETKGKLLQERKEKKAGKKIVKFARKNFAKEEELLEETKSKEINGVPVVEAFYKGFLDPAVRKFIDKYYKLPTVQNYKNGNKYKSSYYFKWAGLEAFKQDINGIFNTEKNAFKCNVSMSYVIYKPIYDTDNYEAGKDVKVLGYIIRYFHSSANNNTLFDHPVEIHDRKTLINFSHEAVVKIAQLDKLKGFEDSGWKFYTYLHYEVVVFKTNLTIGNAVALPEHFYNQSNEKNLIKFDNYDDNLCFWRCLAVFNEIMEHSGGKIRYDRFEKPAKNLFVKFYDKKYSDDYKGIKYTPYSSYYDDETCDDYDKEIKIDEIDKVEELFKINIHIYTQDEKDHAEIDRRNSGKYDKDIYLLRHNNHFCLIKDIKAFIHSFRCRKCGKSFPSVKSCGRHEKTCGDLCKHEFPGGFCEQTLNTFQKLKSYGIKTDDYNKFFDHFIVYDFETILSKTDIKKTDNLKYTNKHVPVSFSIFSNVDGFNVKPIHVVNNDPKRLIELFVSNLLEISKASYEINKQKYKGIYRQIGNMGENKARCFAMFEKWIKEVPVIGFNSAKYDCNIMKVYLCDALQKYDFVYDNNKEKQNIQALKTGNSYRVITSDHLKFLDVSNFLAAGTSLDKWLKAYKCEVQKAIFPYEWLDDYNKLYDTNLPDYDLWFSSLKNKNVSMNDYNEAIEIFNKHNFKNMFDYLEYYNNCDVIPMVEAINKMFEFYRAKNLDMFKDAISLPGLAYKMLMNCPNANFSLFEEQDKNLYYMLKNNIRGGPSIIFNRYQEVDKTLIRGNKLCKSIVGFDANALYLGGIMQEMPVGKYKHITEYNINELVHDILNDKFFGFVEVDIKVPDELYEKFSEMSPIFKNIVIDSSKKNVIGEHMFDYCQMNNIPLHKSKKLIGSMFGEKICMLTTLVKWYLQHGLIITKFYEGIQYNKDVCFKELGESIADARRAGDADKSMEIIAETMKLIGNSLYGRCVMNKEKHIGMTYANDNNITKKINDPHFKDLNKISDNTFEVFASKRKIKMDVPIQVGCAVYDLAKLRMLEFYYDFIDKYIDRSDFVYCQMDTDSAYIAFSAEKFEDLIKPELKEDYLLNKYKWFPRDDTKENAKFDKRTPGLFKEEYRGKSIIALCPKMYFVEGADHEDKKYKFSSKGIQKDKNDITKERFEKVLTDQKYKDVCTNKGFRVIDNYMITYTQEKKGMSYYYDKRVVCPNGIDTLPLPI